jgi:hypothetical protein
MYYTCTYMYICMYMYVHLCTSFLVFLQVVKWKPLLVLLYQRALEFLTNQKLEISVGTLRVLNSLPKKVRNIITSNFLPVWLCTSSTTLTQHVHKIITFLTTYSVHKDKLAK